MSLAVDPWNIIESEFTTATNYLHETIFAVGNGYIGMRGNFEEGYQGPPNTALQGTYLNGFYESAPIYYDEIGYGYAKYKQTMLNVTNSKIIKLYLDAEEFSLFSGKILKYKRNLDLTTGVMSRELTWESPQGKQIIIEIKRLIPLQHKHLAIIDYQVTPLNFSGKITLLSALDGHVTNLKSEHDPRVGGAFSTQVLHLSSKHHTADYCALTQTTTGSKLQLVCGMRNELEYATGYDKKLSNVEQSLAEIFTIIAHENHPIHLSKYISYYSSRDYPESKLLALTEKALAETKLIGFEHYLQEQTKHLQHYWEECDVKIEGDPALQQGIRFNQLQLLMSIGKDGKTSIASKGVTGEGYEGHYFWDADNYVLPFFLYTRPEFAKKQLEYRYSTLVAARARAREVGHSKGALYAWRTINGNECSSFFLASTAQYHINADIILALKLYLEATNDQKFLLNCGAEMAFETARLWADLGCYIDNKFCINGVTGPDEYAVLVDNNFYTNIMAQMNLQYAVDIANHLAAEYPSEFATLKDQLQLTEEELSAWQQAAAKMKLPYDEIRKIHKQDDSFLNKKPWDFANTPKENHPLLVYYHYLLIYRHQVIKQGDVVLADFWFGDQISLEQKKRDYDYYEPLTTHDSSLSMCTHSIMAAEIGYSQQAYNYFMQTARLDLDDLHGSSKHGIHSANMAGTWLGIAFGFAGMRTFQGKLSFNPKLPESWHSYSFKIIFQNRRIKIKVTADSVIYTLLSGDSLSFNHRNTTIELTTKQSLVLS